MKIDAGEAAQKEDQIKKKGAQGGSSFQQAQSTNFASASAMV